MHGPLAQGEPVAAGQTVGHGCGQGAGPAAGHGAGLDGGHAAGQGAGHGAGPAPVVIEPDVSYVDTNLTLAGLMSEALDTL